MYAYCFIRGTELINLKHSQETLPIFVDHASCFLMRCLLQHGIIALTEVTELHAIQVKIRVSYFYSSISLKSKVNRLTVL